ncbi:Histidine kinase-, DNA gyrase B-, and HSP90-like ATPase [Duganella sp. CF402]|uniref:sensor histidine kinase n=1 Tax=unclassified Duganella TaxID=2636909 RepID=UPI0008C427BB|nr:MULTISPECIES: hybrid sensor histidine kinase/response regulator [unclassified Duganella]RZT01247.1 histidine kinase/DNA gyrase B/HSP90-like ATPase [Duganella sp. BK701]SEN24575.1 Histidine kinase-, DNA gyrase B-, and HSP90-like ATPase [Duganella sp. CF402]
MNQSEVPVVPMPTILIVDDSPSYLAALLDRLERHGFLIVLAQTAAEGLMRAAFAEPDLILLDVVMPDIDGFEACRRLKAGKNTKDIPVIFMTGLTDPKQKVTGFDAGGVDYITKPFQIEEVLARINTHLALRRANRELHDMIATLAKAREDLVHNEKLAGLGALVAGIAHELNTPIGNSLMAATTFEMQTEDIGRHISAEGGITRKEFEHYIENARMSVDILSRNLHRAADIVTNFKQVAVDQTSSQRRSFLLDEVIAGNVLTLQPTIKRTPFTIQQRVPHDLMMESYPGPLGQVVTNLINNAILHGYEGRSEGVIAVSAQLSAQGWVTLSVEDHGVGIARDDLPRIFDPFFTTKMGVGGSGLGLNIVHNIVTEILGGRIDVSSEVGGGTRFTLTLPMSAPLK